MSQRGSIVLPPSGGRSRRPLPGWVGAVALVGLAILALSTFPAAVRRTALAEDLQRLREETGAQERRLLRFQRAVRDASQGRFSRERALRRLLLPPTGATRR